MRTTLDLPDNLVNEAMKATQIKTKTKVIITALEQLIQENSMAGNLQKEIEKIKREILTLGAMVEDRFKRAIFAIKMEDLGLAQKIIDTDFEIDEKEIEVEEDCLKILALYQPVATDLRFLVAVIKINNDLERVADYAANIAKRYKTSIVFVKKEQ